MNGLIIFAAAVLLVLAFVYGYSKVNARRRKAAIKNEPAPDPLKDYTGIDLSKIPQVDLPKTDEPKP